ncbi:MAG TPA: (2Fe-2S)-binding protein [Terriglobales bacterium]|nr:(2Fe-2S)-binding protein [Terriglobales bacterium]
MPTRDREQIDLANSSSTITATESSGVSRRDFLKISGITAVAVPTIGVREVQAAGEPVKIYGPGKVPIELTVNGKKYNLQLEPRVTLLDTLRDSLEITGAKRVCDRAECGACTVLLEGKTVYACSILAIDAQGKSITTVESFVQGDQLHPIQQAFVENDGSQCGFCTPGFVVATKALFDKYPNPTPDEIRRGLSGNYCRCGTYHGIQLAVAQMQKGA